MPLDEFCIHGWLTDLDPSPRTSRAALKRAATDFDARPRKALRPLSGNRRTAAAMPREKPVPSRRQPARRARGGGAGAGGLPMIETPRPSVWPATLSLAPSQSQSQGSLEPSRSSSPSKKVRAELLEYGESPIHILKSLARLPEQAPASAGELWTRMKKIQRGHHLLPQQFHDTLAAEVDETELGDEHVYTEDAREDSQPTRFLEAAGRIMRETRRCLDDNAREAAWNCQVHNRILDLALDMFEHDEPLRWVNITTAAIEPAHLAPRYDGLSAQMRKVDFAVINDNPSRRARLQAADCLPINQTFYKPLFANPVAFCVETKPDGSGEQEGLAQLGVWAAAQFARMRETLGSSPAFLPQILVLGAEWRLVLVWSQHMPEQDLYETFVASSRGVGQSQSVYGIAQIVALLQSLCYLAVDDLFLQVDAHVARG